jgi:hypothetical protein
MASESWNELFEKVFGVKAEDVDISGVKSSVPSHSGSKGTGNVGGRAAWGQVDLSDFIGKLRTIYPEITSSTMYVKGIRKGAQLLADRIEAATPIRSTDLQRTGKPEKQYKTKGHVKLYHPPATAKKSVIIHQRKGAQSYDQAEVNANLSILVGYEKNMAYYMYWREVGNKFQPARAVIRPAFDAGIDEALQVALDCIVKGT